MNTDYMRAFVEGVPAKTGPIRFVAGNEGLKRDGRDYRMAGMDLARYQSNPVVMWVHNMSDLPIGRAHAFIDGPRLITDVEFDMDDPFAAQVDGKYRRGYLNAVSMTAIPTDGRGGPGPRRGVVEHSELVEVSAVPVPLDPDALAVSGSRAMNGLGRELIDLGSLLRSLATDEPQIEAAAPAPAEEPSSQGNQPVITDDLLDEIAARLAERDGSPQVDPADTANDLDTLSALAAALPTPKEGNHNG